MIHLHDCLHDLAQIVTPSERGRNSAADYTITRFRSPAENYITSSIVGVIRSSSNIFPMIPYDGHVYQECAQNRVGALPGGRYAAKGSGPFFRERLPDRVPAHKVVMLDNQKELDPQNLCSAALR